MIIVSPIIRLILKIASIILFVVTFLASFGGLCNPEYLTFPSVLVLALPYLAIATFVTGLAWLISGRFVMAALAAGTLIACWGTLKDVTPIAFSRSPHNEKNTFRLITFNCLHFADTTQSERPGNRAIKYLAESGADIICLQEMHNLEDPSEIHHWSRELIDSLYAAYPYRAGTTGSDLKVLSRFPVEMKEVKCDDPADDDYWRRRRRWQLFEVDINGFRLPIVNFHMDSYDLSDTERGVVSDIRGVRTAKRSYSEFRHDIFPKLGAAFRSRAKGVEELASATAKINPLIACGDFNDVPGSWSYRLMRDAGFNDAYAETNFGPVNTFNQFLLLFHIDQIFYRGAQLRALDVRRLKLDTSDHYPMEATFEITR
ncbi:MAG: endonuclease/exonuclease/phosphatase family protein [Muribaculaceae bacterium]|nr:endonuclease/exonuclease/phosphatase family protein [Muribaculaceae bacterium]